MDSFWVVTSTSKLTCDVVTPLCVFCLCHTIPPNQAVSVAGVPQLAKHSAPTLHHCRSSDNLKQTAKYPQKLTLHILWTMLPSPFISRCHSGAMQAMGANSTCNTCGGPLCGLRASCLEWRRRVARREGVLMAIEKRLRHALDFEAPTLGLESPFGANAERNGGYFYDIAVFVPPGTWIWRLRVTLTKRGN